eukprot:m.54118 g.54118  ORF g.54118 m.54118 type:complete len:79 (-) comp12435_c0_seq2:55-291(-)
MAGVGGPLPLWWYDQQAALNKRIVTAMRTLGIKTILPGFQGNVPVALKKVYPSANISNAGWYTQPASTRQHTHGVVKQ